MVFFGTLTYLRLGTLGSLGSFSWVKVRYVINGGLNKSLIMVQNILYSNGPPSHVTLPFEYRILILSGI